MNEVSKKQLEANRKNAKLGGVKTEEGKAISKYNAIKHGLLSKEVLLEGEDEKSLVELGKRFRTEINPVGEVEMVLTDRIISNIWRLRRLLEVERAVMEWEYKEAIEWKYNFDHGDKHGFNKATKEMLVNEDIEKLSRYETTLERSIYKALHELQRIQAARAGEKSPLPVAVDIDINKE